LISSVLAESRVVKESGLACLTYGKDNSDKAFVGKQIEAGVDAVIVDSVVEAKQWISKEIGT
jgi:glycerophosphodiester phosphodiesterase